MPLSDDEQRILQEMEQSFYENDPMFADKVRSQTVYKHAGSWCKWAALGFVIGLVILVVEFSQSVILGFAGFLIMLLSAVTFERNLRRMGKAGMDDLMHSTKFKNFSNSVEEQRKRFQDRFKRDIP
ncbi:MAG: DUF3040 domain-containing protein [Actinobacteria bacterium]|nr:DUF3040 domain-containing protein [Actinomycetota bacterium]MCL6104611.1 DUF3040 domain-containing protein [Actinomycetota bacterium]